MSSSSSSNRPAALGALLWIFLIIGAAGLVMTMLSVAGVTSTGNAIGIILLLVGIVGAVLFAYISSYFSPATPAKEAAVSLAPTTEAPISPAPVAEPSAAAPPAEAPVAEAVIVETPAGEALVVEDVVEVPVAGSPITTPVADISDATPVADIPVADISIADAPVLEAVIIDTSTGEALVVEDVIAETPTGETLLVEEVVAEVPVAEAVFIETPVAATFSSEPASPPQPGFTFVSHTRSFNWRGAGAPGSEEWVFALANSPTVSHTYRVTAREGSSSSAWYPGGGIVDIMIDGVPTGQLMVVANEKKAREDVAGGNLYRVEMEITSDGLTPATIASQVTVNGVALR